MSWPDRCGELNTIVCITIVIFLLIALITYHPQDPAWSSTQSSISIYNLEGRLGAYCSDALLTLLGITSFLIPYFIALKAYYRIKNRSFKYVEMQWLGMACAMMSLSALISLFDQQWTVYPEGAGGWLGRMISWWMLSALNPFGATLMLSALFVISLSLILQSGLQPWILRVLTYMKSMFAHPIQYIQSFNHNNLTTPKQKIKQKISPQKTQHTTINTPQTASTDARPYIKPSTRLLALKKLQKKSSYNDGVLKDLAQNVEEKLKAYQVKAVVEATHPGPVITQLELRLESGIKASKVTALSNDLARLLSVQRVRVVEIIPGKSTVGLELPNPNREMVYLREILESETYQSAPSALTLALGKNIAGEPVVADLAKMPHLLVAGTTGSGKSVGLNTMILSLLYKASPDEVKLILIDPKMLELSVYQDIPHLLTPVVTDVQEATGVLKWCVQEMERRYKLIALLGVRNLASYNEKIDEMAARGEPLMHPNSDENNPETFEKLPQIVVIADEFADMMMVLGKSVEQLIARIAQKARAAGIHLILATQRPSVDVITGLIKANVPTRIAFQVSSRIDSRTILDQQGAEQLLGSGDMLYLPVGASTPTRVHGAFISDDEVHRVVKAIKTKTQHQYDDVLQQVVEQGESSGVGSTHDHQDPLYAEAVKIVAQTRRASISSIQRRLRIGYNRAATLIEKMEADGLIGPMTTASAPREVLMPQPEKNETCDS
ncbi:MAG: cell division protein FtsK [Legionellales bacterium]|nr:cell division protein FtsK [Legionellales bacterium]